MRSLVASSLVAAALALPAAAFARPSVTLTLSALLVSHRADGAVAKVPLSTAKPGDRVEYDILARNAGDEAARNLVTVERIRAGTAYVAGSAKAIHGRVEFSLDGARWSSAPTVAVKNADGTTSIRKADPAAYTAVRFVESGALAANATDTFSYEVRLK